MKPRDNDFPYMTDSEVRTFWAMQGVSSEELTQEQRLVQRKTWAQPNLKALDDLRSMLLDGRELSQRLTKKVDEVCELVTQEVA